MNNKSIVIGRKGGNLNSNFIYTESLVGFYDIIWERFNRTDREFYLNEMNNSKGSILEIGTGTGRIFIHALEKGADIYGIDVSEVLQDYLKKRIDSKDHGRLKIADVRNFNFGKKFDLIIAPFRMFSHMLTVKDQLSALNCIHDHLTDKGRFIFDVFLPDLDRIRKGNGISLSDETEYVPGRMLQFFDASTPDYINQLQHVTFKYVWDEFDGKKEEVVEFPFRYFFRYELEHLIARSGMKLEKMYGDFEYGELCSDSKNLICVCSNCPNLD